MKKIKKLSKVFFPTFLILTLLIFNVFVFAPEAAAKETPVTDVTLCKEDEDGKKLPGWELSLVSKDHTFVGITEEKCANTGCVTFIDVPYGTYQIQEQLKKGWINVSGLGQVEIDKEKPTFTIVNKEASLVTIIAYKVVCENESYLPNWAKTSGFPSMITEGLVSQYVADSEGKCWFEASWEFEWGEIDALKMPGDHYGPSNDASWNIFGPTDSAGKAIVEIDHIEERKHFWIREVLKPGYLRFAHPEPGWDGAEPVKSAELLCHIDGYKYDNYDRVDNPQAGESYYCVAFNAPEEELTTNVTLCKEDEDGKKLPGWELSLVSDDHTFSGITEPVCENTGCVTFIDVPYGIYQIQEQLKKGWVNVSGLGEVEIDQANPTFTIVNKEACEPEDVFFALSATTTGSGTITSIPEGINCGDGNYQCEQDYLKDAEIVLTAEPGSGYKFGEWGGDCSGTSTVCLLTMDGAKEVAAAFVLIPCLVDSEFTVTFNGNSGTPELQTATTTDGGTIDPLPIAAREGYDFVGWNKESAGTGEEFTASTTVVGNITVYAQWSIKTYTVTFEDWDGEIIATSSVEHGSSATAPADPQREGYVFTGWDPADFSNITEDLTVTAQYEEESTAEPVPGCMDPMATNYNLSATVDDSSCQYEQPVLPAQDEGVWIPGQFVFAPEGEVLGEEIQAEDICGIYLFEYIKYGANNNPAEVIKLQNFLNAHMGLNLAVSGTYDLATRAAVDSFQLRYKNEVLKPWVDAGIHCNVNDPTGYVYKTTKRWINLIVCPILNIPMPDLSGYAKADCSGYFKEGEVLGEETKESLQPEKEALEETTEPIEEELLLEDELFETATEEEEEPRPGIISFVLAGLLAIIALAFYFLKKLNKI